jgi:hypothetical protein
MMKMSKLLALGVLGLAAMAGSASAHHSFAMFDSRKVVTLSGTVKEFQWTNPHIWIELQVPTNGRQVQWSIEGGAISMLRRQGWNRESFKQGDRVTVTINPLKSGDTGGSFVFAQFPNGRTLGRPPGDGGGFMGGRGATPVR